MGARNEMRRYVETRNNAESRACIGFAFLCRDLGYRLRYICRALLLRLSGAWWLVRCWWLAHHLINLLV